MYDEFLPTTSWALPGVAVPLGRGMLRDHVIRGVLENRLGITLPEDPNLWPEISLPEFAKRAPDILLLYQGNDPRYITPLIDAAIRSVAHALREEQMSLRLTQFSFRALNRWQAGMVIDTEKHALRMKKLAQSVYDAEIHMEVDNTDLNNKIWREAYILSHAFYACKLNITKTQRLHHAQQAFACAADTNRNISLLY